MNPTPDPKQGWFGAIWIELSCADHSSTIAGPGMIPAVVVVSAVWALAGVAKSSKAPTGVTTAAVTRDLLIISCSLPLGVDTVGDVRTTTT